MTFAETSAMFDPITVARNQVIDQADRQALEDAETMCNKLVVGEDGEWLYEACKRLRLMRTVPNRQTLVEFDQDRSICFFSKTAEHNLLGAGAEEHYQRFEFLLGDKVIKLDVDGRGRRRYRVEGRDGRGITITLDKNREVYLASQAGMHIGSSTGRVAGARSRGHGPGNSSNL